MILLDYKDRRPIYEQIIEKFQQMILCGALQAGDPMPSVRSLAMELSINPNTIQRAYQELERRGYIVSIKGKGSFVSDTADAAEAKRREVREAFVACVENALAAGITAQELSELLYRSVQTEGTYGKVLQEQTTLNKITMNQTTPNQDTPGNLEQQHINSASTERQGE